MFCFMDVSTYYWTHSKNWNNLTPAQAEKWVYVHHNTNAIWKFVDKDMAEKYIEGVLSELLDD